MTDDRLYKLHAQAEKSLESGPQFNWSLPFECAAQDLSNLMMPDVQKVAAGWRSEDVPEGFYFTHAQYYKDGIQHIIGELNRKPTSNRALYSLISQDHIEESGDDPIPSFMTLQCQIADSVLYCTCYFRALEVSNFLKINLEEIRQTLVEIHAGAPRFSQIKLTIFAFRAYLDKTHSSLLKPKLEILHDDELLALLIDTSGDPVRELAKMLRELHGAVTAVSAEKLISLKRILAYEKPQIKIPEGVKKPLFLENLNNAIEKTLALGKIRKKGSHGTAIEDATKAYQHAIDKLCNSIEN